jgi:hypothetical protein
VVKGRDPSGLRRWVCWCLLAAAFLLTLLFLVAEGWLLRFPFQRDYGEGHVLWMTQQILDAGKAYRPIDAPPYVVFPYPPLYMLATRLANVFLDDLLLAGRALSLFSGLGIGVALALTVMFSASARAPLLWRSASGAFAGVLPLLADNVVGWASLMRVDMLALFLMYAGLGVYIVMGRRERWQYLAAVLFVLALFTKQTTLSAPLACLVFGLLLDRRRTIRVGACAAALTLAGALYWNVVTHGGFLTHVLEYNINPFSWKEAGYQIYRHAHEFSPWLVVAAVAFLSILTPVAAQQRGWRLFLRARSASPFGRAVLLSGLNCAFAAIATLSVGKLGASSNHLLIWDISICLLCGFFLFRVLTTWAAGWKHCTAAGLTCILLPLSLMAPPVSLLDALLHNSPAQYSRQSDAEAVRAIRRTRGPVFSENLLLLAQAGKSVEAEPATITFLAYAGRWDERPYVRMFDEQHFSLLVAYDIQFRDRFTPATRNAIERAYVLDQRIGGYSLYRPRQRTSLPNRREGVEIR